MGDGEQQPDSARRQHPAGDDTGARRLFAGDGSGARRLFAGDGSGARRLFAGDDAVLPFSTVRSGVEGRVVRLAGVTDKILGGHGYPEPVSRAVGEALALTAMLGTALKPGGRLIVEARTDGPLRSLAINFEAHTLPAGRPLGRMRGYAGFDPAAVAAVPTPSKSGAQTGPTLIGKGHLALTIEEGAGRDSYQGVAAIDGGSLSDAARSYFKQSEQLPTFIRLAVARELMPPVSNSDPGWRWRVGGLMIQHLAATDADAEENWRRARLLAETLEDHELIDPLLPPERLLLRLFHEEGVRVRDAVALQTYCRCSRERIAGFLQQFGSDELADLRAEDGSVVVTCEFCGTAYVFAEPTARP